MLINTLCTFSINNLLSITPPISLSSSPSLLPSSTHGGTGHYHNTRRKRGQVVRGGGRILCGLLPVDPWASAIDPQTLTNLLFAFSLFPYLGFLHFISRVESAPKLTLFGFHFLLVFVGATKKVQYGASLSNTDWLHGGAESLLALSNLFVVLGLREALRNSKD
ncbi:hypothetical protein V2J09_000736 [Rumex salicifolius]